MTANTPEPVKGRRVIEAEQADARRRLVADHLRRRYEAAAVAELGRPVRETPTGVTLAVIGDAP